MIFHGKMLVHQRVFGSSWIIMDHPEAVFFLEFRGYFWGTSRRQTMDPWPCGHGEIRRRPYIYIYIFIYIYLCNQFVIDRLYVFNGDRLYDELMTKIWYIYIEPIPIIHLSPCFWIWFKFQLLQWWVCCFLFSQSGFYPVYVFFFIYVL